MDKILPFLHSYCISKQNFTKEREKKSTVRFILKKSVN